MNTATFDRYDSKAYTQFSNPSLIEKDLQTLSGIITGIKSDNTINETEYHELVNWINENKQYQDKAPYKEVIGLLREAIADNFLTAEESNNIIWYCNQYIQKTGYFNAITGGIQKLQGIVKGIVIDQQVNMAELAFLDQWLEENEYLKNTWPYDELYNLTTKIIQDKVITPEEHDALLTFCNALTSNTSGTETNYELINALKTGFYQIDPQITIPENTFCITGVSKKYKRREIAEKIELYGGYMVDNVSAKLNYLVVCNEKNNCWAFTCYGRKIEEAVKWRKEGKQLVIVHEFDLYDALENL